MSKHQQQHQSPSRIWTPRRLWEQERRFESDKNQKPGLKPSKTLGHKNTCHAKNRFPLFDGENRQIIIYLTAKTQKQQ